MMNETIELTEKENKLLNKLKQKVTGKKTLAFAIKSTFKKEEVPSLEDAVVALRKKDIIAGIVYTKDTSISFNKKHEISEDSKASIEKFLGDSGVNLWPL